MIVRNTTTFASFLLAWWHAIGNGVFGFAPPNPRDCRVVVGHPRSARNPVSVSVSVLEDHHYDDTYDALSNISLDETEASVSVSLAASGSGSGDNGVSSVPSSRREFMKKMLVSAAVVASLPVADAIASESDASGTGVDDVNVDEDGNGNGNGNGNVSTSTIVTAKKKDESNVFDIRYFIAGGLGSAFSHGISTPFDVVKTKMQANPELYTTGARDATISLVEKNGPGILLSGLGPTIIGFGIEGGIKFGVYESLKPFFMMLLHTDSKTIPYLAASVGAGMVAAAMLCPMERTRIKMVTSEEKTGPFGGIGNLIQEEGFSSLFFGYPAMLGKQIPYTMTKQVSFDIFAAQLYALATLSFAAAANEETRLLTTASAAFFASILACTISQPGDVIVTQKFKGGSEDSVFAMAKDIYEEKGLDGFFAGYTARLGHVACIVTSQLVVYDILKQFLGLPATGS